MMSESGDQSTQLREARRTARRLHFDGVLWFVYELPTSPVDRGRTSSLIFESDDAMRRVRDFPANWRTLNDDALFALSWSL